MRCSCTSATASTGRKELSINQPPIGRCFICARLMKFAPRLPSATKAPTETRGSTPTTHLPSRWFEWAGDDFLQAVECLGVRLQNFPGLGMAEPTLVHPAADFVQRAQVGGDIGVAVVSADHQIIFGSELQ